MKKKLSGLQCLPKAATQNAAVCPGRSEELASHDMDKDERGWTEKEHSGLCCQVRGVHVNEQVPQTFWQVTAGRDTVQLCAKPQNAKAFLSEALLKGIYRDWLDIKSKIQALVKMKGKFVC